MIRIEEIKKLELDPNIDWKTFVPPLKEVPIRALEPVTLAAKTAAREKVAEQAAQNTPF